MLRANSKQAKENLFKVMVREISGRDNDPETAQEGAYILAHDFIASETGPDGRIYLEKGETYQDAFYRWASGLTNSIFDKLFYTGSACELVAEVLEESEEEKAKYTEAEAEEFFCAMLWVHGGVAKEFYNLYRY